MVQAGMMFGGVVSKVSFARCPFDFKLGAFPVTILICISSKFLSAVNFFFKIISNIPK